MLDTVVNVSLAVAALAIAGSVVYRAVQPASGPKRSPAGDVAEAAPLIKDWASALPFAIQIWGDSTARVTLVEFTDLECPSCRGFHDVLKDVAAKRQATLRVLYAALPLSMHRFAMPAARAMECADSVHAARRWMETVYSHQDSLGLSSWEHLASLAGIQDSIRIARCARDRQEYKRISGSMALAASKRIQATPTFWINGWQFTGASSSEVLGKLIDGFIKEELDRARP